MPKKSKKPKMPPPQKQKHRKDRLAQGHDAGNDASGLEARECSRPQTREYKMCSKPLGDVRSGRRPTEGARQGGRGRSDRKKKQRSGGAAYLATALCGFVLGNKKKHLARGTWQGRCARQNVDVDGTGKKGPLKRPDKESRPWLWPRRCLRCGRAGVCREGLRSAGSCVPVARRGRGAAERRRRRTGGRAKEGEEKRGGCWWTAGSREGRRGGGQEHASRGAGEGETGQACRREAGRRPGEAGATQERRTSEGRERFAAAVRACVVEEGANGRAQRKCLAQGSSDASRPGKKFPPLRDRIGRYLPL